MGDTFDSVEKEMWLPCAGFEWAYEVSSHGRIRSIERLVPRSGHLFRKRSKILTPSIDSKGYCYIKTLPHQGAERKERVNLRIHRLIMLTFAGESGLPVDHINKDKSDNRLENLRYITVRGNMIAAIAVTDDDLYIHKHRYGYRACTRLNGKKKYIGSGKTKEEVRIIRDKFLSENNIDCFGVSKNIDQKLGC